MWGFYAKDDSETIIQLEELRRGCSPEPPEDDFALKESTSRQTLQLSIFSEVCFHS